MARTTKSVSRARSAGQGGSQRGAASKRGAARRGGGERGAAKTGSARRRSAGGAAQVKGWTVQLISGESLQLEADSVELDGSGTVTFSLNGATVLFVSPASYSFIMETSEPLEGGEAGGE